MKYIIDKDNSKKILMIGVYYKHNAPGGMASVIQYYDRYIENLQYISSWKDGSKFIKFIYFIKAYIKCLFILAFNHKIQIVHIHTAADNSFWRKMKFIKLALFFKKKTILHVHASRFKDFYQESSKQSTITQYLNHIDNIIVLSQSWKQWFQNIGVTSKIIVLNNIVDYPQINKSSNNDSLPIKMLFLGELGKRKGVFDILKVISDNKDFYKERLIFRIGGNKNEDAIKKYIKENKLDQFVFFEGWVSGSKKVELLNWANTFILPSFNEGLPISILEAISYHCAIIASPVGGIPEIIHNQQNGILVTPGNNQEIHNAIVQLINNPAIINTYINQNEEMIHSFYPKEVLSKLSQIYHSLIYK